MDEDIKQLIEKNLELTERIARDVKKMRHHFWMANIWSILKIFVFIVVPTYLAYVYIQPYVGQVQGMLQQIQSLQQDVSGFQKNIGDLQKNIGGLTGAAGQLQNLPTQLPKEANAGALQELLKKVPGLESLLGGKK